MSDPQVLSALTLYILDLQNDNNASICDRVLENSTKSHMKYAVFLHVFNVISANVCVFLEYFLNISRILAMNFTEYHEICNPMHVAVINITKYRCVIWNHFPKSSHIYCM